MLTSPRAWRRLLLFIAFPFGLYGLFSLLAGGAYAVAVVGGNYFEDQTVYGANAAEARATGTWLATVLVVPNQVRYGQWEISFDQCWLEQLRTSHRPAWYKPRTLRWLPRATLNLRYHTRYLGPGKPVASDSPVMSCGQDGGGQYLVPDAEQSRTVYADILPDSTLALALPLDLRLTGGPDRPVYHFQVYPAGFHPLPQRSAK